MAFFRKLMTKSNPKDPNNFVISPPYDAERAYAAARDDKNPTGFKGLPPRFQNLLEAGGITKLEASEQPGAMGSIIDLHLNGISKKNIEPLHKANFNQAMAKKIQQEKAKLRKKSKLLKQKEMNQRRFSDQSALENFSFSVLKPAVQKVKHFSGEFGSGQVVAEEEDDTNTSFKNVGKMITNEKLEIHIEEILNLRLMDPSVFYDFSTHKKDLLGEGSYGKVYKGKHRGTKRKVAIKTTRIDKFNIKDTDIRNEIALHALCGDHENIVDYVESFYYQENYYIICGFVDGGALAPLVAHIPEDLHWDEKFISFVAREMLRGLAFMHSYYRIHRDIKSDNVLVGLDGSIKLTDFGYAVNLTTDRSKRGTQVGTPYWMAPELIIDRIYDSMVDIWSFGITALEMAQGEPPHMEENAIRAMLLIGTGDPPTLHHPQDFSPEFNHILLWSLKKSPKERAEAEKLLMHPFLRFACEKSEFGEFVMHLRQVLDEMKD